MRWAPTRSTRRWSAWRRWWRRSRGGRVLLRILSNLADRRLARARVHDSAGPSLGSKILQPRDVRDNIIAAWAFAAADPYRAATHNKGIMNGVDAVVMATGNDWRAVEAGAHAYAARGGRYTSLSHLGQGRGRQPGGHAGDADGDGDRRAGRRGCIRRRGRR